MLSDAPCDLRHDLSANGANSSFSVLFGGLFAKSVSREKKQLPSIRHGSEFEKASQKSNPPSLPLPKFMNGVNVAYQSNPVNTEVVQLPQPNITAASDLSPLKVPEKELLVVKEVVIPYEPPLTLPKTSPPQHPLSKVTKDRIKMTLSLRRLCHYLTDHSYSSTPKNLFFLLHQISNIVSVSDVVHTNSTGTQTIVNITSDKLVQTEFSQVIHHSNAVRTPRKTQVGDLHDSGEIEVASELTIIDSDNLASTNDPCLDKSGGESCLSDLEKNKNIPSLEGLKEHITPDDSLEDNTLNMSQTVSNGSQNEISRSPANETAILFLDSSLDVKNAEENSTNLVEPVQMLWPDEKMFFEKLSPNSSSCALSPVSCYLQEEQPYKEKRPTINTDNLVIRISNGNVNKVDAVSSSEKFIPKFTKPNVAKTDSCASLKFSGSHCEESSDQTEIRDNTSILRHSETKNAGTKIKISPFTLMPKDSAVAAASSNDTNLLKSPITRDCVGIKRSRNPSVEVVAEDGPAESKRTRSSSQPPSYDTKVI